MNASEYDKMFELEDHYWWFVGRRRLALDLLRRYLRGEHAVLDLGCGTGVVSREMQSFASPVSLDMSGKALDYCRKRSLSRCIQGDGAHLPLQESTFGGVLGLDIYEHIEDDELAFRESFRVLQPGGVVILSVPAFRFLWGPHDLALHHFRRYTRGEMERKLAAAGFVVERCSYSVFFLFPIVVLTRVLEKMRRGPARASLPDVPGWMNRMLISLQEFEAKIIVDWKVDLPWGSSVVAVGRKPTAAAEIVLDVPSRQAA